MGELTKQVGQILYDLAGPTAKEIGEMVKDELRPYRARQQARLAEKTVHILEKRKVQPVAVAPKILLSVFENAGLEDDEEMHDRWATLLANAATPDFTFPISIVFVEILKQISPQEAVFLDRLAVEFQEGQKKPQQSLFPKPIKVPEDYELGVSEDLLSWYDKLGFTAHAADFNVVLSNLQRLGVLQRGDHVEKSRPFSTREGNDFEIEHWEVFYLTSLGYQLVLACQPASKES